MIYRFEDCELDIGRHELRRSGIVRSVEPQVFDLLHFLIANRHRAVSRDEIFEAVWRGRIVSDSVLGNRINAARKAIQDDGIQQRLIRTLRRNGFRFVGAVSDEVEQSADRTGCTPIVVRPGKLSLIVLSSTTGPVEEKLSFIAKGIADGLTTTLARSRSFDVIAHNRTCAEGDDPSQIAHALDAVYVIVCGLREANNQARLTVRLIDACTGLHIWARHYTYEASAGLADQDAVTTQIAAAVEPSIYAAQARRQSQRPFEALDPISCVTMALTITRNRTRQNYEFAERLLSRAIELDPDCVRAHAISSYFLALQVLWGWKPRLSTIPLALAAANQAVVLDEHDPWAHFALGWALMQNRSTEEAVEKYEKTLAINACFPTAYSCLGLALGYLGRIEKALEVLDDGERLDAAEIFVGHRMSARATVYSCDEDCENAIKAARRSVQQAPALVASQRQLLVNAALGGEMAEAQAAFQTFKRLVSSPTIASVADSLPNVRDSDVNRTLDAFRLMGLR